MSMELRIRGDSIECDWGVIEHSEPRPDRGEVGHLMIATSDYVSQLLREGPDDCHCHHGGANSATELDGRLFAHIDYEGQRWTWELFNAHWWDNAPQTPALLVGRWPD